MNGRGIKRRAQVPLGVLRLGTHVSKADLLEAALSLASLTTAEGCDDLDAAALALLQEINAQRALHGARPIPEGILRAAPQSAPDSVIGSSDLKEAVQELRADLERSGVPGTSFRIEATEQRRQS